jgi:two-component system, OmpR family, KDP operon response regulator KdpE
MGGVETCRSIRHALARMPILMLSVKDSETTRWLHWTRAPTITLQKPFQLRELAARLRSGVRRRMNTQDATRDAPIRHGHLELDPVRYRVMKRGQPIHLTPKEFEMLHYLMMHAGEPIPHARLLKSVWGPDYGNQIEYLEPLCGSCARRSRTIPETRSTSDGCLRGLPVQRSRPEA